MNRIRIDELNGKTRFFGVAINTHEHKHTSEHNGGCRKSEGNKKGIEIRW